MLIHLNADKRGVWGVHPPIDVLFISPFRYDPQDYPDFSQPGGHFPDSEGLVPQSRNYDPRNDEF